jgi:hypothetical protein
MPLSLASKLCLQTLVDQFGKIGIFMGLTCTNRQGWGEEQNE